MSLKSLWPMPHSLSPTVPFILAVAVLALPGAPAAASGEAGTVASRIRSAAFEVRPVAVIDRSEIEASGASSLHDLLAERAAYHSYGLYRPLVAGEAGAVFLVDGRRIPFVGPADPFSRASHAPQLPPLSAVERVEILDTGAAALHAGGAVGGAVNVVLRRGHEGAEAWAGAELPDGAGGDTHRAGGLWGGKVGQGRLTLGAERFERSEIRVADRGFSRGRYAEGGDFADTVGVSVGGNTVFVPTGEGAVARPLGACERSRGYSGVLDNPAGVAGSGCGFVWADIAWHTERLERRSVFASLDHPLGPGAQAYFDGGLTEGDTAFRFAPSAARFAFSPPPGLRARLLQDLGIDAVPDTLTVAHRFVAHGNRDWRWSLREHDATLGLRGRLSDDVRYDVSARSWRHAGEETGGTFVSESLARRAIDEGRYDIENPFSTDPAHLAAVREMALSLSRDRVVDRRTARAVLDSAVFALPGGSAGWAAGLELDRVEERDLAHYRDASGNRYGAGEALGSGDSSYRGERVRRSGFAELRLAVPGGLEVVPAARIDGHDDVGTTASWQLAGAWRAHEGLLVRGSWETGRRPPSLRDLHAVEATTHPFVCDTLHHRGPLAQCDRDQVNETVAGNPRLEPARAKALSLGVAAGLGMFSLSADWFRIEGSELPARFAPQRLVDAAAAGEALPPGAAVVRNGGVISEIRNPLANLGERVDSGIDIAASAAWKNGPVDTGLDVHWLYMTERKFEVAGESRPGDFPRHRVHATLRGEWQGLGVAWAAYGVSGYDNDAGTERFDRWIGHDVLLDWRDPFGLDGTVLRAGVLNLADREPSVYSPDPGSTDARFDSIRGRTLFLGASAAW